jgi:hypothetical protein
MHCSRCFDDRVLPASTSFQRYAKLSLRCLIVLSEVLHLERTANRRIVEYDSGSKLSLVKKILKYESGGPETELVWKIIYLQYVESQRSLESHDGVAANFLEWLEDTENYESAIGDLNRGVELFRKFFFPV